MDMAIKVAMISTKLLVVLLVVMEAAFLAIASPASVNIYHDIQGVDPIQVDCAKGSHRFAPQTLLYGQHFGWGFTPSIWQTTRYVCQFAWGMRTRTVRVWSAEQPCNHVMWRVTREGFYRIFPKCDYGDAPALVSGWY